MGSQSLLFEDVLMPLSTPYRLKKAARAARVAAHFVCFTHVGNILWDVFIQSPDRPTLFANSQASLVLTNALGALLALWLGIFLREKQPAWAVYALLGWSLLEVTPGLSYWLYGHGTSGWLWPYPLGALLCSILALRGVRARKADRSTSP